MSRLHLIALIILCTLLLVVFSLIAVGIQPTREIAAVPTLM